MIDFSKTKYSCDNQMSFDECLKEMDNYKWETGQYMNLPEMEEEDHEDNGLYPERTQKRNIPKKSVRKNRVK